MNRYCFEILTTAPYEAVVDTVKDAFKAEGFGTLTEIDVQATLRDKIAHEMGPYTILGMCNPNMAAQAITLEPNIGLMLPCNVLIRQHEDGTSISAQDPEVFMRVVGNAALTRLSNGVRAHVQKAMEHLRDRLPPA